MNLKSKDGLRAYKRLGPGGWSHILSLKPHDVLLLSVIAPAQCPPPPPLSLTFSLPDWPGHEVELCSPDFTSYHRLTGLTVFLFRTLDDLQFEPEHNLASLEDDER